MVAKNIYIMFLSITLLIFWQLCETTLLVVSTIGLLHDNDNGSQVEIHTEKR